MQTIQLEVDDHAVDTILTLLKNMKAGMVKELKVLDKHSTNVTAAAHEDESQKLREAKGILRNRIADPVAYQRSLRSEWDRS